MDLISEILSGLSWKEIATTIVDLALVYFLVYRMLLLIKGTRAVQMVVGIIIVLVLFFVSREEMLNLTMVNWILDKFVSYFILVLIVLFQPDIRRALSEMGRNPFMLGVGQKQAQSLLDEVANAACRLSARGLGALIVLEREADLRPYCEDAVEVDAKVTAQNLFAIFLPSYENPLHDGAVVIRQGRISHAGCFLPLTENPNIDKQLGTRHRAAIGLTEATDAVVVVVSEETRVISVAFGGELKRGFDGPKLKAELSRLFGVQSIKGSKDERGEHQP
jgi:diadenylate cyclase